ncbi:hypothetical protein [Vibrio parahaemolyticus]|uniref:hypothetical protein n=1 Tax=Vibrio parahaemolyticus TaxID=670 RepID=UPI00128F6A3F|nr:hypothetical protein [Vibrio parahaemolyticus]MQC32809.1 hypothetical protein [Vibrio parahaemolyticus]HCE1552054.1 hypothetical protein [Vibrio parahaemolyticus]HCG5595454.1 hypothetical protein [Vibrio parahaemolyticus]HCG6499174.1 hypothetical protein [Vibrio parahaemolyticus]HCH1028553.1 hypothetical protein [Vibrio parahaemolyticus]
MRKIVIVVFSLLFILIGGYYGLNVVKGRATASLDRVSDEAKAFAKTTDKNGCILEFIKQYKSCDSISCISSASMSNAMCFVNAEGNFSETCEPVINPNEKVNMSSVCTKHKLGEQECVHLYQFYDAICNDAG